MQDFSILASVLPIDNAYVCMVLYMCKMKGGEIMTTQNKLMKMYLKRAGIECTPKYIQDGSMKGTWRLDDYKLDKKNPEGIGWWGNKSLQNKLTELGFVDYDGKQLSDSSGNGGQFSVFVIHKGIYPTV